MKELTFLHDELAIMRAWQGECKRMELYAVTTQIAVIEKTLKAAQEKIAEERAEEIAWAYKAEKANYKDAEANIAETVYGARVGWYRVEVAKMEAELKKLRRKAKRTLREIDKFDDEAKRFNNGTLNANTSTKEDFNANAGTNEENAANADEGEYCFECGQWIEDVHNMEIGMWVQPSHERGTVNEERCSYNDRYYAEFVCTDCLERHYHQCQKCAEFYHESRCTQDEQGNWICENCREDKAE